MYNVYEIRKDFPELALEINGQPNTFLDTAASAQKPEAVLSKIMSFYSTHYSNVHRSSYYLAEQATAEYEEARETVARFLNASSREIVFTRSATEGVNLVAATWGMSNLHLGDEILLSEAEHHANLVPWQIVRDRTGCSLKFFAINDDGSYNQENFYKALSKKTKLIGVTGMSNVLGTVFPVKEIAAAAHACGALCLVDACQSIVHQKMDVKDIDCDFLVFSGHKTYGPTGVGVLYGKYELFDSMPPYQTGGDMVKKVTYEHTEFAEPPARFEAGTPAIAQVVGLGEALKYMQNLGLENIAAHEKSLLDYTNTRLAEIPELKIVGTAPGKGGVISFVLDNIHAQDVAFVLDKEGVAIRTGHHCAEPVVNRMGYTSLARASFGLYTTREDIDCFVAALAKAKSFFKKTDRI